MRRDLAALQQAYPQLEIVQIGSSVMGKPIEAVRLGEGAKTVHYNGAFHANEWITSLLLMRFLEVSLRQTETMQPIWRQVTLWIVPMVNPDGVDLAIHGVEPDHPYRRELTQWNADSPDFRLWKANIRGVDLNDQFPAYWEVERVRRGVSGPGPRDYAGTAPLTEPEAIAMADFTRMIDAALVIAFHSQGEEIYWNYRNYEPENAQHMAEQLARASGYKAVRLESSDAGYKDWFIHEFGRPGFTVEVGKGENPLPLSDFAAIYRPAEQIMRAALSLA